MASFETFVFQFETKGSKMVLSDIQQISEKTQKLESLIQKETKATGENTKKEEENTKAKKKQTHELTKQNRELWTLAKRLIGLGSIYAVLRKGWSLGINFMQQGQGIRFMANSANMATGAFQRWAAVAKKFGGNENSVTSTMMGISSQIEEMRFGQVPMQEVAARYGIALPTTKDPEQFLLHLAKALEGRRPEQQRQIGRQMGFGEDIIRMLQLGYGGLQSELGKATVKLDSDQIAKADRLNKAMVEVQEKFHKVALNIGSELSDTIVQFSEIMATLVEGLVPMLHELFKENGFLEKLGASLYEKGLIGNVTTEGFYSKLFGDKIGKAIASSPMGIMSKPTEAVIGALPILSGHGGNVVVNNENNIVIPPGQQLNEQKIAAEIGIVTERSGERVANTMISAQG